MSLIAPLFGIFGTITKWFQRDQYPKINQPIMQERIKSNFREANINPCFSSTERHAGLDELGIKIPNIPRFNNKHNRVVHMKPLVDKERSLFPSLDDKLPAINKQDWDEYRKKRHKKIYHNHKLGIDHHGEPFKIEDDND